MLRTIETTGVVNADHTITLKLPDDFPEGECQVVVVSEIRTATDQQFDWGALPTHDLVFADPNDTFRREDMYGDDER
jgi:hypothetical protein